MLMTSCDDSDDADSVHGASVPRFFVPQFLDCSAFGFLDSSVFSLFGSSDLWFLGSSIVQLFDFSVPRFLTLHSSVLRFLVSSVLPFLGSSIVQLFDFSVPRFLTPPFFGSRFFDSSAIRLLGSLVFRFSILRFLDSWIFCDSSVLQILDSSVCPFLVPSWILRCLASSIPSPLFFGFFVSLLPRFLGFPILRLFDS